MTRADGMPARIELVIFDCDGVLVDSEPVANRIFADALIEIGLDTTYERTRREFTGRTMEQCVAAVEQRLGRPIPAGFVDRLQERTFAAFRRDLRPVPGVADALRTLGEVKTCVASSGEPEKMRLTLELTGLLPRFDGRLFSATEVGRGKPHPDLFLHAAREMDAGPESCVVVEDSVPGVRAGVSAAMAVLGYAAEDGSVELLERAGATVFRDMRDLPALLGLLPAS